MSPDNYSKTPPVRTRKVAAGHYAPADSQMLAEIGVIVMK